MTQWAVGFAVLLATSWTLLGVSELVGRQITLGRALIHGLLLPAIASAVIISAARWSLRQRASERE